MGVKKLIQFGFNAFGLQVSYKKSGSNMSGWDFFFSALKARGFNPEHIIDVGVNHGLWSRTALNYFPDSYYTLIEPQDWLKKESRDILARGKAEWITAGVGDKQGILPLWVTERDDSCTFAFSSEALRLEGGRTIDVPIITLDQIVETSAVFPEMVKIDAEGFDLKVIAGASTLLGKTDIFILEATVCAPTLENTMEHVLAKMSDAGYRPIDIPAINRSPKHGLAWLCDIAFLRNDSPLLLDISYE
jgi:FkbM family methyltransferase